MNATRIGELNKRMRAADLDALFVSNPKNVLYLSGFHTTMPGEVQAIGDPEGFVLVHRGAIHLLCDGRYIAGAGELPGVTAHRIDSPTSPKVVADAIRTVVGSGRLRIGYEADALLHCDAVGLLEHLSGMECVRAEAMVIGMRLIKSRNEIDLIRTAQEITGACFDHVAKKLRPGISEYETAFEIDTYLRKESEGNSFSPIVAFGETGARPHYSPDRNRQLQKGQMVLLDFGAVYHGYCGDMTRMAVLGRATDRHREV